MQDLALPLPHYSLPADPQARWLEVAHQFGSDLMTYVRDRAYDSIPLQASEEAQSIAREAVHVTLQALAALLDGVTGPEPRGGVQTHYALLARFRDEATGGPVEAFELAHDGDGLCMAIHGWLEDDFDEPGRLRRAGASVSTVESSAHKPLPPQQQEPRVFSFDQQGWGRCPFCDVAFALHNPASVTAFHSTCRNPLIFRGPAQAAP